MDGLLVGGLTGFVGVGGGFLIVPALVLMSGLSMQHAIASSLVIIALKSAAGFYKYVDVLAHQQMQLDWPIIFGFAAIGALGGLYGKRVACRVDQEKLKNIFAWLLVGISVFIVFHSAIT